MNYRLLVVLALSILIYFANLGGSSIYILDEAKNAGCAMEMAHRHDPIVPTFNGVLRTDKPALHYFFMMAAYQVFDVTPFAARLFSALSGILLIVFLYVQVKKIINEVTAFYSCLILLSSIQLAVQFHLAVPDPYLITLLTICFISFYNGFHDSSRTIYWMYVTAAFAFMAKGLIAVAFPALVITAFILFTKQLTWQSIVKLRIIPGALIFLLIALPWYIAVAYATDGEWPRGFFIEHNLDRYTSTMEGHRGFPLAPFVILIGALLPFSVFIIQAVRLTLLNRKANPFLLFCLIIIMVIGIFFSISKTILPSYPAPAIPFLAIVLGYFLTQLTERKVPIKGIDFSFGVNLLLCIAMPIAVFFALKQEQHLADLKPIAWLFCVLPLGSIVGWYLYRQQRLTYFVYSWSGSWMLASLLFFYVAYPKVDQKNPVTESMPLISSRYSHYDMIVYKQFNPAYVFKLRKTINVIESSQELSKLLSGKDKVLVFTRVKYAEELNSISDLKIVYQGRDLFEGSETLLLAN